MEMTEEEMDEQLEKEEKLKEQFEDLKNLNLLEDVEESYADDSLEKFEPEIGELYAVKLSNIESLTIDGEKEFTIDQFQWHTSTINLHKYNEEIRELNSEVGDSFTLLKYQGNHIFIEFYTGITIGLYEEKEYRAEKESIMNKTFNPLVVSVDCLEDAIDDIKSSVVSDIIDSEEVISYYINMLQDISVKSLNRDFNKMFCKDYETAKAEDKIRKFIKK